VESVQNGTYKPLSRPLFVYVPERELERDGTLRDFVRYMVRNQRAIADHALFVPLSDEQLEAQLEKLEGASDGA
jgi:phosphate transport system substrate-binding protein